MEKPKIARNGGSHQRSLSNADNLVMNNKLKQHKNKVYGADTLTHNLVWTMLNPPDGFWERGIIIEKRKLDAGVLWEFTIDLFPSGETVTLRTVSIDKYNYEFEYVKRCDKDLEANAIHVPDMTSLSFLNEPEILEALRVRFFNKQIYTNTGPILIALNPFEYYPIYSLDVIEQYRQGGMNTKQILPPHVFQIADRAYHKMFVEKFDPDARENQVILVNGESGAGKTESTKQILHYLAVISSQVTASLQCESLSSDIEDQVVASNPIMESFGNSKTLRNNNSSRFGKFIEIMYSAEGFIEGATIRTYLLETVRIVRQMKGERNYHVFYEINAGLSAAQKKKWGLTRLEDFRYTNQSGEMRRLDKESDLDNFSNLRKSLTTMNIEESVQDEVLKIVVGVMHLGNLNFMESTVTGDEAAHFSADSDKHVKYVCELLGFDAESLMNAIGRRSMLIAGNVIQKTINVEGAIYARDNFSKTIYELLFKWIVARINRVLVGQMDEPPASLIGVLDIFGFEFFAKNSFEQLCINYTNEKLQDHFNYAIFKSEQEIYKEEGLQWTFVEYPDNSARLDLLENKTYGVFALVNEQLKLPKSNDDKLANALYQKCGSHKFFSASKAEQVRHEFTIMHFACNVTYQTTGLLEKNRCEVAVELTDCIAKSTSDILKAVSGTEGSTNKRRSMNLRNSQPSPLLSTGSTELDNATATPVRGSNSYGLQAPSSRLIIRKSTTVASQLSGQLHELMIKIRSMRSHFVRCIKPNNELKPGILDKWMVMSQLRCGGVLGAVKVFQAGFPNRISFQIFVSMFSCFSLVSGANSLTRGLINVIDEARTTALPSKYRFAAARLLEIVPLSEMVMNITEKVAPPPELNIASGMQMGRTNVFLRSPVFEYLGRLRLRISNMAAHRIQILWRARRLVKKCPKVKSRNGQLYAQQALRCFADHNRLKAVKAVCSAIMLQRRVRVFLCVQLRKLSLFSIVRIQSCYRKHQAVLVLRKLKSVIVAKIQRKYRQHYLRNLFLKKRSAAVTVQKYARRLICQCRKSRIKLTIWAVSKIQLYVKRFLAMKKNKVLKKKLGVMIGARLGMYEGLKKQQYFSAADERNVGKISKDVIDTHEKQILAEKERLATAASSATAKSTAGSSTQKRSGSVHHKTNSPGDKDYQSSSSSSSAARKLMSVDADENFIRMNSEAYGELSSSVSFELNSDSRSGDRGASDRPLARERGGGGHGQLPLPPAELTIYQQQIKTLEQKIKELEQDRAQFQSRLQLGSNSSADDPISTSWSSAGSGSGGGEREEGGGIRGSTPALENRAIRPIDGSGSGSLEKSFYIRTDPDIGPSTGVYAESRAFLSTAGTDSSDSDPSDLSAHHDSSSEMDKRKLAELIDSIDRLQRENLSLKEMLDSAHTTAQKSGSNRPTRHFTAHLDPANQVTQEIPPQWVKKFSDKHKKHYWKNKITGKTSWTAPTATTDDTVPVRKSSPTPSLSNASAYGSKPPAGSRPVSRPPSEAGLLPINFSASYMSGKYISQLDGTPNASTTSTTTKTKKTVDPNFEKKLLVALETKMLQERDNEIVASTLPNLRKMESQKAPRERLYRGWRVTKHGKYSFPKTRMLQIDEGCTKLMWRKYNQGQPETSPDGEAPLDQIARVTKGKQSTVLGRLKGLEDSRCLTIHIKKPASTLDLELATEEERDVLHGALLQTLNG